MAKILVDNLKPGMMLNEDVTDITGRLLMKGGTEIREANIQVFKAWGVTEVDIKGAEGEAGFKVDCTLQVDIGIVNQEEKKLRELFILNDLDSPVVKEIFRLCLRNRLRAGDKGT